MNLEQEVEPFLSGAICKTYWDSMSDHADFRAIVDAIDLGGGQCCDVPGVLRALHQNGFIIRRLTPQKS